MTRAAERIHLPEALDGPWDHAVICTYNANLAFYEQALARKLGTARNRVLLIDQDMLDEAFDEAAAAHDLRHVNAGYLASPVTCPRAAHAKFILLTSAHRGRLLVGSGNLTMSGYAGKGELFTKYDHNEEIGDSHQAAFLAVKELIDAMVERSWVDDIAAEHLAAVWPDTPWIYNSAANAASPVRHNIRQPILDQFLSELAEGHVDRLTVHAPYWDRRCEALNQLLERTSPRHVLVLVQPGEHEVDGNSLEQVLSRHASSWEIRPVRMAEPTFLHAKLILAEQRDKAVCLQGSANLSVSALLRTAGAGNIELVNLLTGPRQAFTPLVDMLQLADAVEPSRLVPPDRPAEELDRETPRFRVVQSRWDGRILTIDLNLDSEAAEAVLVAEDRLDELDRDQHTVKVEPAAWLAERLDRDAPIRVEGTIDGELLATPSTYPYRLRPLRSLLTHRTDPEQLRRIAKLELGIDDDIEALLRQLDDALIIDRSAIWKMAGRGQPPESEDEAAQNLKLSDLDWDQLARHPKFAQYHNLRSAQPTDEPTDLQILLSTLTSRLGELGVPPRMEAPPISDSPEVGGSQADPELDELDEEERAERQEAAERARDHALAQQRRAFGSFVESFVRGLTDPAFGELVGPDVVAANFVLLNALLGRLLSRDRISHHIGVDEHLRALEYFWGPGGYLELLSDADRHLVGSVMADHDAHAVTLAAIYRLDATCQRSDFRDRRIRVRNLWRRLLASPHLDLDETVVRHAAAEATAARAEPEVVLVEQLQTLATDYLESEIWDAVGTYFGIDHHGMTEQAIVVGRGDRSESQREVQLAARAEPLDRGRASRAFATWMRLDPRRGYYRILHTGTRGRALLDTATGDAWWMADLNDDLHDLGELPDIEMDWEGGLHRLARYLARLGQGAAADPTSVGA